MKKVLNHNSITLQVLSPQSGIRRMGVNLEECRGRPIRVDLITAVLFGEPD